MVALGSDLLLSLLGAVVALWSLLVVLVTARSDMSKREMALDNVIAALGVLLIEQGKDLRERRGSSDVQGQTTSLESHP